MRLLITGWQGQLAQALTAESVRDPDVKACAIGRPALDLCSLPTIERAMADVRPTLVVNTAAYTAVDAAESNEAAAHALNATGAGLIAKAAAQRGIPVIHISTDYVYDGTKPAPYVEGDPTGPINAYGRTKLAGEHAVVATNPRHLILRTSWVYSPVGGNFVKTMLRLARDKSEIGVVDDQIGCPTYAPHMAQAILAIARRITASSSAAAPWGIYHCAGSGETTWCGFARAIFERAAKAGLRVPAVRAITTAQYPTPARRPANSRLDCTKLATAFGVSQPSWQQGLDACLEALLQSTATPVK